MPRWPARLRVVLRETLFCLVVTALCVGVPLWMGHGMMAGQASSPLGAFMVLVCTFAVALAAGLVGLFFSIRNVIASHTQPPAKPSSFQDDGAWDPPRPGGER